MSPKTTMIVALSLIMRVAAQDVPKASCRFANGKTIVVTSSDHVGRMRLATDESLVTMKGISVPPGNYIVSPSKDSRRNWTLTMRKANALQNGPSQLLSVPMFVVASVIHTGDTAISFDPTGGSCTMFWGIQSSNVVLSLEFSERNTDIPVLR